MAALAGLVPPLLVSFALVAGLRRATRHSPVDAAARPAPCPGTAPLPGLIGPTLVDEPAPARPQPPAAPRLELACRACGWALDRPGWVDDRPTSAICDCCACEACIDDVTPERARAHRRRWVEHGAEWFDPGSRPEAWDLYAHLCELAPVGRGLTPG